MPNSERDELFNSPLPAQELSEEDEARERDKHEKTADAMLEHVPRQLRLNELGDDGSRDGQ